MKTLPPEDLTKHRKPLLALTGIRFVAAAYVVLFHTETAPALFKHGWVIAGRFVAHGYAAVPLFFLLSGFILAYTYRFRIHNRRDCLHFWEARFARLWPGYVFALLCSSIFLRTTPHWPVALATLTMVQAWDPFQIGYAGVWNFVCWTLSVEALFYLLFPWIQRSIERLALRFLVPLSMLLICIGVLCNLSAPYVAIRASTFFIPEAVFYLPHFVIGALLGNFFLHTQSSGAIHINPQRAPLLTYVGFALSFTALAFLPERWISVILPGFALIIYGLASERSFVDRLLSTRLLVFGGSISYSIYLLQLPVRAAMRQYTPLHGHGISNALSVPVALALAASLTYLAIEQPSRRALRRLFAAS